MSTIKEKKEFFTNLNTQGEEINFDKNRQGGNEGFRLFKNGNYPDEAAFEKLFSSILFSLNKEDRAKPTLENTQINDIGVAKVLGGHTTIATNDEAKNFENGDEALYTRTTRPSQLPETIDGTIQDITIESENYVGKIVDTENISTTESRNIYQSSLNVDFIEYLKNLIENATEPVGTVKPYYGTKAQLESSDKRFLFLDGSSISKEVNGNHVGEKFESLYFQILTAQGISEINIIQSWNNDVPLFLPNTSGIFIQGAGTQSINGIEHNGSFGIVQGQSFPEHNHPLTGESVNSGNNTLQNFKIDGMETIVSNITDELKPASLSLNYIIKY